MSSVANYEVDGYPIEEYTRGGNFHAIRKVRVAWSDVDTFISELDSTDMLYPYDGASGATVYRVKIEKQPGTQLTALAATGLVSYPSAFVTIYYSTTSPRYYSGLFYTERIQPYREYHTVDPENLYWDNTQDTQVEESQGVLLCGHVYELTYFRATSIPAGFFDYAGYTNSNQVITYSFGRTYAVGTLLHADPTAERTTRLGGTNSFTLRYRWIWRGANSGTWNTKWRPDTATWATIFNASGTAIAWHPSVNFALLV